MASSARSDPAHGREADRPSDIPARGWKDILWRTKDELSGDHVSMIAASVAFYGLLAIFPAIAATIALWGLFFDPAAIQAQMQSVSGVLPPEAAGIVTDQARSVASATGTGLSLAAVGGVLIALYSASKGVKALIEGLNIIYDEEEKRGFIMLNLVALGLMLATIVMVAVSLALIAVLPALLGNLGLGGLARGVIAWLRWPLLALMVVVGLAVLYRFGPSRDAPRWRWVSWGAVIATVVWIAGSMAFSLYVRNFAGYNETYGSLGAVVILLMWFWLSAYIVLMGAELNSEMERQTARDSTEGPDRPLGGRGARAADTVGEAR
jgi:membrane protein